MCGYSQAPEPFVLLRGVNCTSPHLLSGYEVVFSYFPRCSCLPPCSLPRLLDYSFRRSFTSWLAHSLARPLTLLLSVLNFHRSLFPQFSSLPLFIVLFYFLYYLCSSHFLYCSFHFLQLFVLYSVVMHPYIYYFFLTLYFISLFLRFLLHYIRFSSSLSCSTFLRSSAFPSFLHLFLLQPLFFLFSSLTSHVILPQLNPYNISYHLSLPFLLFLSFFSSILLQEHPRILLALKHNNFCCRQQWHLHVENNPVTFTLHCPHLA